MSNYIVDRSPKKYGGVQNEYLQQVDLIVAGTSKKFHQAVSDKRNLQELFHEVLNFLGTERHRLAVEHGTKDADAFGFPRDQEKDFPSPFCATPLSAPYEEYNTKLMPFIYKHLNPLKRTLREFKQTELKVQEESYEGRKCSLEFSILTFEKVKDWSIDLCYEEYKRFCKLCSINAVDESSYTHQDFFSLVNSKKAMLNLKQNSIEDYKKFKLSMLIGQIRNLYEGRKSDWVLATIRFEVDNKMYALSQYLTWLYRDYSTDPFEHMKENSIISVVHQDPFLINPMLQDIAKIFQKVIEYRDGDVAKLKNTVALLQYEIAHAMPFKRGSAAISEWLEMAIYRYHGFKMTYNSGVMVNLEALTLTPAQFVREYEKMIKLQKIENL